MLYYRVMHYYFNHFCPRHVNVCRRAESEVSFIIGSRHIRREKSDLRDFATLARDITCTARWHFA